MGERAPKLLYRVALCLAAQWHNAQNVVALCALDLVLALAIKGEPSLFVQVGSLLRIWSRRAQIYVHHVDGLIELVRLLLLLVLHADVFGAFGAKVLKRFIVTCLWVLS